LCYVLAADDEGSFSKTGGGFQGRGLNQKAKSNQTLKVNKSA